MEGSKEEGDWDEGDDDFKLELGVKLWQRAREESCAKRVDTTTSAETTRGRHMSGLLGFRAGQ